MPDGCVSELDGVPLACLPVAPAVENDQNDRAARASVRHGSPRILLCARVTQAPQSSPALRRLPACAVALGVLLSAPLAAQNRIGISGTTDLRRTSTGGILGTLTDA